MKPRWRIAEVLSALGVLLLVFLPERTVAQLAPHDLVTPIVGTAPRSASRALAEASRWAANAGTTLAPPCFLLCLPEPATVGVQIRVQDRSRLIKAADPSPTVGCRGIAMGASSMGV